MYHSQRHLPSLIHANTIKYLPDPFRLRCPQLRHISHHLQDNNLHSCKYIPSSVVSVSHSYTSILQQSDVKEFADHHFSRPVFQTQTQKVSPPHPGNVQRLTPSPKQRYKFWRIQALAKCRMPISGLFYLGSLLHFITSEHQGLNSGSHLRRHKCRGLF